MLKKLLVLLGVVFFLSCGGGSSEEAKELLQKILTIIGIPPSIITNICQTSNQSDICEGMTLYNNKKSDKNKTWQKIKETGVGQYLIETNDPCKPILLELKDSDVVDDNGEFFLKFSGVEFGKTTKELSILEAMVDASYLSKSSVIAIKSLNSAEAQNSFYATLYQDLKTNINTLRTSGLTKTQAIRGTLKEMAEELSSYGVENSLPNKLNSCSSNTICVKSELTELSSRLVIYASEVDLIVNVQKDNDAPLNVKEVSCEEEVKEEVQSTAQTFKSTLKKTGQTTSYEQFDDGAYQIGVTASYSRSGEIVTDNITKLQWQDNEEAETVRKTWEDAKSYCLALSFGGKSDWRLPSVEELKTLVVYGKTNPTINLVFQNISSSRYLSSTSRASDLSYAWVVEFYFGHDSWFPNTYEYHVRCVRGGE